MTTGAVAPAMYTPDVARGKPKCAMSRPARPSKRHDFATPRTGRRPLWFGMRGSRCPGATFAHPFPGGDRSNRVRIVRIVLSPNGSNARRTPRTTERFERSERQMLWSEPVTELDCQDVNEQERAGVAANLRQPDPHGFIRSSFFEFYGGRQWTNDGLGSGLLDADEEESAYAERRSRICAM